MADELTTPEVGLSRKEVIRYVLGIGARVESTLVRMREIPLSTGATIGIVALATGVWGFDFLCLLCSFGAVQAAVPWAGVLLAYGVAQVAAALAYRMISFWLATAAGWITIAVIARQARRSR